MLAVCSAELHPDSLHQAVQSGRVRVLPGVPVLLGQDRTGQLLPEQRRGHCPARGEGRRTAGGIPAFGSDVRRRPVGHAGQSYQQAWVDAEKMLPGELQLRGEHANEFRYQE